MAKITTYDYNRAENSLTVTYESGTVRRYSVDFTPKSVQTFIMTNIVDCVLSEYKQKFLDRKNEIFPLLLERRNGISVFHNFDYDIQEVKREVAFICAKLNYISEFSEMSLITLVSMLQHYYIALECGVSEALSEDSDNHYRLHSYQNDYDFLSELVERFRIPVDDCSFNFTLEHLLSVAFPDREYDAPETEDTTSAVPETTETLDTTTEDTPKQSDDCKDVVECYVSECPDFSCCKKALLSAPEKHSDVYDWHGIKFIDREHRQLFERLVSECRVLHDPYRLALFYLIALDSDCRRHIREIYDFRERCVNSEVLDYGWITDTSRCTLKLAFSLFNGFYFKADVSDVFSCYYEYMEYYFDAVRLRFQRW